MLEDTPPWFSDVAQSIGSTLLVRLNRIADGAPVTILAKLEGRGPGKELFLPGVLVILPDSGERYLSLALFEGMFDSNGLPL